MYDSGGNPLSYRATQLIVTARGVYRHRPPCWKDSTFLPNSVLFFKPMLLLLLGMLLRIACVSSINVCGGGTSSVSQIKLL